MDEVTIIILSVGTSVGAVSALWLAILKIFGKGYLDKLNRDWKTKQEKDIVELKSSFQIYKSSTDIIQEKRIKAIEELWTSVLELKEMVEPLHLYYIATDAKGDSSANEILKQGENKLPEYPVYAERIQKIMKHDIKYRPFLTNKVWKIYHIYRGFILRILFHAIIAKQKNEKISDWRKDKGINALLKLVFSPGELTIVYDDLHTGWSTKFVFVYLEESLLIEMNKTFSGESIIRDQRELFENLRDETSDEISLFDIAQTHNFQLYLSGFRGEF
jgi:hypothetical protein